MLFAAAFVAFLAAKLPAIGWLFVLAGFFIAWRSCDCVVRAPAARVIAEIERTLGLLNLPSHRERSRVMIATTRTVVHAVALGPITFVAFQPGNPRSPQERCLVGILFKYLCHMRVHPKEEIR